MIVNKEKNMKVWQCIVCKYIHKGENPPEKCPVCNVPAIKFKEIDINNLNQMKIKSLLSSPYIFGYEFN